MSALEPLALQHDGGPFGADPIFERRHEVPRRQRQRRGAAHEGDPELRAFGRNPKKSFRSQPSLIRKRDRNGRLPLRYAACSLTVDVVHYVAGKSWQALRKRTDRGSLPIHLMAQFAKLDVVQCLADK